MGGETSDRPWRDALGVLKVQGQRLDRAYMRQMAIGLGVQDLAVNAIREGKGKTLRKLRRELGQQIPMAGT